jgi:hypothetical protein
VSFLLRQESLRFDDLDFDHPLLAGSTMGEIREALAEIAAKANDELAATYSFWMGGADTFTIGTAAETQWQPLSKLRYANLRHRDQLSGRAAIVYSTADIWLVHYIINTISRTNTEIHYAIKPVITREPATYYRASRLGTGPFLHERVVMDAGAHTRLIRERPILAALTSDMCQLINISNKTPISSNDLELPLHQYISTNLRP